MTGMIQFTIGAAVSCADGLSPSQAQSAGHGVSRGPKRCGRLSRVVVDPVAAEVTHLAVEPEHREGLARLVPVELAAPIPDGILLACTLAQFAQFDSAEETQFVPGTRGYDVYGPEQVLSWPYYRLGDDVMNPDLEGKTSETVTVDTIPLGEIAVRRGAPVQATDRAIGHVEGLVIDPASNHITHVLLQEGHLWGRKQVAIPIGAVRAVADEISLSISAREVQDLPPVGVAGP